MVVGDEIFVYLREFGRKLTLVGNALKAIGERSKSVADAIIRVNLCHLGHTEGDREESFFEGHGVAFQLLTIQI